MLRSRWLLVALLAIACSHAPPGPDAPPNSVSLPRPASVGSPAWQTPASAYIGQRNRCIDQELATRNLNEFGDPEGTAYPGGSPLLNLAEPMDRYEYVMHRWHDIDTKCTKVPGEPER